MVLGVVLRVGAKVGVAKAGAKAAAKAKAKGATGLRSRPLRRARPREYVFAIAFDSSVTNRIAVRILVKQRCILPHVKDMVSYLPSVLRGLPARMDRRVHTVSGVSINMGMDKRNLRQNTEVGMCKVTWLPLPSHQSKCLWGRLGA
jgi:hypothetical protein